MPPSTPAPEGSGPSSAYQVAMGPKHPLIVFSFDDTLFPTTALRAFCAARVKRDPTFTLKEGAGKLLEAWDDLVLNMVSSIAVRTAYTATLCIVTESDKKWVESALAQYLPRFYEYAKTFGVGLIIGGHASKKGEIIGKIAEQVTGYGRPPKALVVVGGNEYDAQAAKSATWAGSEHLEARGIIEIEPYALPEGETPLDALQKLAMDLARVSSCIRGVIGPKFHKIEGANA